MAAGQAYLDKDWFVFVVVAAAAAGLSLALNVSLSEGFSCSWFVAVAVAVTGRSRPVRRRRFLVLQKQTAETAILVRQCSAVPGQTRQMLKLLQLTCLLLLLMHTSCICMLHSICASKTPRRRHLVWQTDPSLC